MNAKEKHALHHKYLIKRVIVLNVICSLPQQMVNNANLQAVTKDKFYYLMANVKIAKPKANRQKINVTALNLNV